MTHQKQMRLLGPSEHWNWLLVWNSQAPYCIVTLFQQNISIQTRISNCINHPVWADMHQTQVNVIKISNLNATIFTHNWFLHILINQMKQHDLIQEKNIHLSDCSFVSCVSVHYFLQNIIHSPSGWTLQCHRVLDKHNSTLLCSLDGSSGQLPAPRRRVGCQ